MEALIRAAALAEEVRLRAVRKIPVVTLSMAFFWGIFCSFLYVHYEYKQAA
jgi:hypothetical protein